MARPAPKTQARVKSAPTVAVIGAGLAGLACANALREAGWPVTVFERSETVGGRCATRATELGGFDHGLQYFTAHSPAVAAMLAPLVKSGVIAAWSPRCRVAARATVADFSTRRLLISVPAAAAVPQAGVG